MKTRLLILPGSAALSIVIAFSVVSPAVVLVALSANSPVISAIVVTIFQQGANYMSSAVGVAKEIASLITGILLLYASCGDYMQMKARRTLQKDEDRMDEERRISALKEKGADAEKEVEK